MKGKRRLWAGTGLLLLFVLWTVLVRCVDVQIAGPGDAKVGFASWNVWFHHLTGVNMTLYAVTDWLGLVPLLVCGCFGSVMPTLKFQAERRCRNRKLRGFAAAGTVLFSAFMVTGRLTAGVHWATDIIGSVLLSAGLFLLYCAAVAYTDRKKEEKTIRGTENGIS